MKRGFLPRFQIKNFQQGEISNRRGGGEGEGPMGMVWILPAIGDRRRAVATASGDVDGEWRQGRRRATELLERRLVSLLFFPDFDQFSSSSSRSWFRRKSVLRLVLGSSL